MKKVIKIFLASSIVEFEIERMKIENFIRNISDDFEKRYDIKIQPLLCENFDDAYTVRRKQEEYNEKIRESELCFFIFFTKAGQYTVEEFEVARKQFEETGNPRIYTYFKVVTEDKVDESLEKFKNDLEKTFGHYYGTFEHIDTVKLRILLSLKLKELDFIEIKTENGKCVIDGKQVMSLKNVSEFANNKYLSELKKELERVEEEYCRLKPIYAKGEYDISLYKKYSEIATKRENLKTEIEELNKQIFDFSLCMSDENGKGALTVRQKEAYRLFEQGDCDGAIAVLNASDIDNDFLKERERIKQENIAVCKKYIREHKTAIDILYSMYGYQERFNDIIDRFERIVPVALEEKIELDTVLEYCKFLYQQNKLDNALDYAKRLEQTYLAAVDELSLEGGEIYNLLGRIYEDNAETKKAEEYYKKAIKTLENNPIVEKTEEKQATLAEIYNNIGVFYRYKREYRRATEYLKKAIEIKEYFAKKNPKEYGGFLASSYSNMGGIFCDSNDLQNAEQYYKKALYVLERIAEDKFEENTYTLTGVYNNIGHLHMEYGNFQKASKYFEKALKICTKAMEDNPKRYGESLALVYSNMGLCYFDQCEYRRAIKYNEKAIEILEPLSIINFSKYGGSLALSYDNIAKAYRWLDKLYRAGKYYEKALNLLKSLAKENPEKYEPDLANSYVGYGIATDSPLCVMMAREIAKRYPDNKLCQQIINSTNELI